MLESLSQLCRKIRLSPQERIRGRNELVAFMQKTNASPADSRSSNFLSRLYMWSRRPLWAGTMAVLLLVTFTGGVSYAAESSLPGDFLYPVKINVTEEIRGAFQWNSESKAEWELERMERRLQEAENLSEAGRLQVETEDLLSGKMKEHAQVVQKRLEELENAGKTDQAEVLRSKIRHFIKDHEEKTKREKPPLDIPIDGPNPTETRSIHEERVELTLPVFVEEIETEDLTVPLEAPQAESFSEEKIETWARPILPLPLEELKELL